jgi:hypothetical protein
VSDAAGSVAGNLPLRRDAGVEQQALDGAVVLELGVVLHPAMLNCSASPWRCCLQPAPQKKRATAGAHESSAHCESGRSTRGVIRAGQWRLVQLKVGRGALWLARSLAMKKNAGLTSTNMAPDLLGSEAASCDQRGSSLAGSSESSRDKWGRLQRD